MWRCQHIQRNMMFITRNKKNVCQRWQRKRWHLIHKCILHWSKWPLFRPHTIYTTKAWCVCVSVHLLVMSVRCAKTTEWTQMPFGVWTPGSKTRVRAWMPRWEAALSGVKTRLPDTGGQYSHPDSLGGSSSTASGYQSMVAACFVQATSPIFTAQLHIWAQRQ